MIGDDSAASWGRLAIGVNRLLKVLLMIIGVPVVILEVPFTLVGGCLVALTFGLLLLLFSLLWLPQLGLLLGTSWLWKRVWILRPPLALVGIPIALIAEVFVAWTPSMGDVVAKDTKLRLIESWPMSLELVSPSRLHHKWSPATEEEIQEALAQQPTKRCRQHSRLLVSVDALQGVLFYTLVCSQCGKVLRSQLLDRPPYPTPDLIPSAFFFPGSWRVPSEEERVELVNMNRQASGASRISA